MCVLCYTLINHSSSKVRFIRVGEVVEQFQGFKEAASIEKESFAKYKSQLDTLQFIYEKSFQLYNAEKSRISASERAKREAALTQQYKQIERYTESTNAAIKTTQEKTREGYLNQINAYAKIYSAKHNIGILLGTTAAGNIMFGEDNLDETQRFIKELNEYYRENAEN